MCARSRVTLKYTPRCVLMCVSSRAILKYTLSKCRVCVCTLSIVPNRPSPSTIRRVCTTILSYCRTPLHRKYLEYPSASTIHSPLCIDKGTMRCTGRCTIDITPSQNGFSPSQNGFAGHNALHWAVYHRHHTVTEWLLKEQQIRVHINSTDHKGAV